MAALPFPTFGTDQQGITPVQMQPAPIRFPTTRGGGTREPEIGEILGGIAPLALEGLMSLFSKDKQSPDDYLKSVTDLTEEQEDQWDDPESLEAKALKAKAIEELDDIERAKFDAWRIYGAPTEKDTFGWDEVAHMAGAAAVGRGGPEYTRSYLNLRGAKERDRLAKETKRQAHINQLLAPVSLQSMDLENINPDSPDFGRTIKAAYNPRTNTFTRAGTGEVLDGNDFQVKDSIRVFDTYQNLTAADEEERVELRRAYVDQLNNRLMVEAITDEEKERANDEGFIEAISTGDQFIEYDPQALRSLVGELGDPERDALREKTDELMKADYAPLAMINVANGIIGVIDSMPRGSDGKIKGSPLTLTSEILNLGNNALANFDQIASIMGDGNIANYFATEASVRQGLSPDGTGYGARRLYQALSQVPKGDFNEQTGQTDYTPAQLERIRYAEEVFEESSGVAGEMRGQTIRDILGEAAYNNTRVKGAMLQLAYMAAAANGQTGRTLSDKDLAFHLKMVGFGQTSKAKQLKENLVDFIDELLDFSEIKVATELPPRSLRRYEFDNVEHTDEISMFYTPPQKEERVFRPTLPNGEPNPKADEEGWEIYTSDNWANWENYTPKTIYERYPNSKELEKWKTYSSPGRTETILRKKRNKGYVGGDITDLL